ncbi:MAG: hypothetical protein ABIM96_02345 [Candidatus Saccharimonas sp.]
MSVILTNNASGGTNGTNVTYYNSGETSGTSWDYIYLGTGASITFSNAVARGNLSYKITTTATASSGFLSWNKQFSSGPTFYIRFNAYLPAHPSTSFRFCEVTDGTTVGLSVGLNSSGKIVLRDGASTAIATTSLSMPVGRWFRVEIKCVSHATAGQVSYRLYTEVDSPYPAEKINSAASFNTRPNGLDLTSFRLGIVGFNISNYTYYLDDLAVSDTAYVGPGDPAFIAPLLLSNNAETSTSGIAVTTSNSGDSVNTPFHTITTTGGATVAYSNAQSAHGSLSYLFQPVAAADDLVVWTSMASSAVALRVYVYFTGLPATPSEFAQLTTTPDWSFDKLARFALTNTGKLRVLDSAGALWDSTATVSLNTWYRFEMFASLGGTATTGTLNAAFYALDSLTALDTFSTTTANLGIININAARFGKINFDGWVSSIYMDEFACLQQASGFIGPYGGPPPALTSYPGIIPFYGWGTEI